MNKLILFFAVSIGFFALPARGVVLETTFDCNKDEYTEIVATGFIDADETGLFLNITEPSDRVYFQPGDTEIARLHANKSFVRMAAKIYKDVRGLYHAQSWALTTIC
jgi:alpha-D-ribose 1-methylphosphonate 5-phosphate C-P lyase